MPFAAAISTHPDPAVAIGEVVGSVLEQLGDTPDVSVVFVTDQHLGSIGDIHRSLRTLLGGTLLGATSSSVLGGATEVEEAPAIALWCGDLDDATPIRLTPDTFGQPLEEDLADTLAGTDATLLLLADPYSFPIDDCLQALETHNRHLQVVGGLTSPGLGPGTTRLLLDDELLDSGAVGLVVGGGAVSPVVSQGCRPIGQPMVVTRGAGNIVEELAGRPALAQLEALFGELTEDEQRLVNQGLHVGRVVDESKATFDRGDFLIRAVMGADRETGAIALGDVIHVGDTIQFQIRDAESAREDLRLALWGAGDARAAIVFTCNGRGQNMFVEPDHDAAAIHERLGLSATAGMFCAGEIGPVGGRSHVHGFTASIAFFT